MADFDKTPQSMEEVMHPGADSQRALSGFPKSPEGWTKAEGEKAAQLEGLTLSDDHWEVVKSLHDFFARHEERVNSRELHDALEEKYHAQGGIRYLYTLFPGGPVSQGCRIAGLEAPAGAKDTGFGSVS